MAELHTVFAEMKNENTKNSNYNNLVGNAFFNGGNCFVRTQGRTNARRVADYLEA